VNSSPGLSLWDYWNGAYNKDFLEHLIAFKRNKDLISLHRSDAAIKKPKKGRRR
jgi:hypothetical protein